MTSSTCCVRIRRSPTSKRATPPTSWSWHRPRPTRLAKMANGYADNLLTSTYLAYAGTVVVAPSMNTNMWGHPATQHNMNILRQRGVVVLEPGAGELGLRCLRLGPHGRTRQHRRRGQAAPAGRTQDRPGRAAGDDHRRRHSRAHRRGALRGQSQFGQDGLRAGAGGLRPRGGRRPGRGERLSARRARCAADQDTYRGRDARGGHEPSARGRHPDHGGRRRRLQGRRPAGRQDGQEPGRPEHPPRADRRHPVRRGRRARRAVHRGFRGRVRARGHRSGRGASSSARTWT